MTVEADAPMVSVTTKDISGLVGEETGQGFAAERA